MVLLQPKLSLKVSQRQILTPGLVQMVSVLALNKLELRDMITAEMVENPVLEELEEAVPLIDDENRKEEANMERLVTITEAPATPEEKKDPFEEIDFGSFFQDYLDPGFRSSREMEEVERPSFENFLSKPSTLTDHLMWQLGALPVRPAVREAAELIIGNLNEEGYLIASEEELMGVAPPAPPEEDAAVGAKIAKQAEALGLEAALIPADLSDDTIFSEHEDTAPAEIAAAHEVIAAPVPVTAPPPAAAVSHGVTLPPPRFTRAELHEALEVVRQLDPPGVACCDLRECLLYQLRYHLAQLEEQRHTADAARVVADAIVVEDHHL
ncbi:MAG: RNA polymerase sigma-54 factor, partial [Acidobacteriales bacterium]|nr:RNA polymerase sigma-54 factor [Terriglobales bacterium]